MSLRKINKNISAVLAANFVVAGFSTSSSVFAGKEKNLKEIVKKDSSAELANEKIIGKIRDANEETDEFEEKEKFVRSLLKNKNCLQLGAKDTRTQWTVAYFFGMLKERNLNNRRSKKHVDKNLHELEKEVKLYLDSLYKYKIKLEEEEEKKRKASNFSLWSWIAQLLGSKSEENGESEKLEGNKDSNKGY